MNVRRTLVSILIFLNLFAAFGAFAQTYPTNNPMYVPAAVLPATTLTTAGTVTFQNNGNATLLLRVAGTNSALSAVVQVTESRASSPTWTTVPVQSVGGSRLTTITANGLYRVNVSGAAQVRFNLASLTGTNVIVSAAGSIGLESVATLPAVRSTYSASATVAPAASATDFLTVTGSASTTVRIVRAACSGTATAAGAATLVALKRSTANSAGTSAAVTAAPLDSTNAAASATALNYTANPTTGTLVGILRNATLVLTAVSSSIAATPVTWEFGLNPGEQNVVLRGTSQVFALNGAGASFPAGASLLCNVTWTEE